MSGFTIQKTNSDELNWNALIDEAVRGNVIPVIGPEMARVGGKSFNRFMIDAIAMGIGAGEGEIKSFSQLEHDPRFISSGLGEIHDLLAQNINSAGNARFLDNPGENPLLRKLLSIEQFPFVITTNFDPVVENVMRSIHGSELQTLVFHNDASKNQDILNGDATRRPTLYYMFGKAEAQSSAFVVTNTDMLRFAQSWLLPNDSGSKAKPSVLSGVLSQRYLLVMGYNYQDWLLRFFWYAMKNDRFGTEHSGMVAHQRQDAELMEFLCNDAKAFSQVEPDMEQFIDRLCRDISERAKTLVRDDYVPEAGTDVFISYSRGDQAIAEELYDVLTRRGLHAWYDRRNMHKGQDFLRQLHNAVKHSTFFVPVLTDTIIRQAGSEHYYRKEWLFAVEHLSLTGGLPYCYPFYEKDFDMDDIVAQVPPELKSKDAFCFTSGDMHRQMEALADSLLKEKERRAHNG